MADNNNRLEFDIVASDQTGPATDKAKGNFRSVEQEAAKSAASISQSFDRQAVEIVRSTDKATAAALRSLQTLEARAALAGKSGVEKLVAQRDATIRNLGADEVAIQRAVAAYDKLITARQKYDVARAKSAEGESGAGHYAARRGLLAVKDLLEGRTQGTVIELTDIFTGTGGNSGILKGALGTLTELTGLSSTAVIGLSAVAATFVAVQIAGVKAMHDIAQEGREVENISLRTGIAVPNVEAYQFAAKASGTNPDILEKLTRGLAQAAEEPNGSGARRELDRLGVSLRDQYGDLKPTEQVLLELSDAINKLPPGLQRSAASMEIFKRIGVEAVPFLTDLRKNIEESGKLGDVFNEEDAKKAKEYHERLVEVEETFRRLKLAVERELVILIDFEIQGFEKAKAAYNFVANGPFDLPLKVLGGELSGAGKLSPEALSGAANRLLPNPQDAAKLANRVTADAYIRNFQASQGIDFKIEQAKQNLKDISSGAGFSNGQPIVGVTSNEDFSKYQAAFNNVQSLERQKKAMEAAADATIAARKEALELNSQFADIQLSARSRDVNASIQSSKGLIGAQDIGSLLDLAAEGVNAEQALKLNERRYQKDEKTGAVIDVSNTAEFRRAQQEESNLAPLRLRNEYAKVMSEIEARDDQYFKNQREQWGKLEETIVDRRHKMEQELFQERQKMEEAETQRFYQTQESRNDRERDLALQQLGLIDAQTLKDKEALESKKFQIEAFYLQRSEQLQLEKLQHDETYALGELQKKYAGVPDDNPDYQRARELTIKEFEDKKAELAATTNSKISIDAQKSANERAKYEIEENQRLFDSLKHSAEGVFDALLTKSRSLGDALKDMFKTAVLTPIKEILASQTAALFTQLLTGKQVTFSEVGSGQGALGKIGSVLGRAGLGKPHFESKLDQPNHLGDVGLVNGAVPVVITNVTGQAQQQARQQQSSGASSLFRSPGFVAAGIGLAGAGIAGLGSLFGGSSSGSAGTAVSESISYDGGGAADLGGTATPGLGLGFGGGETLGIPNGTSIPGIPGIGGTGGGLGGILGGLSKSGGGFLSGLFGSATKDGFFNQFLGGAFHPGNTVGLAGNLSQLAKSPAAMLAGGLLAFDGVRRGGTAGIFETAGGGALLGAKFGIQGAVIGAAIGAGVGLIRKFFFKTDREKAKDLVKQIYGISINDATADQIVQIAKQSYGGQVEVAVRSQQVRDLLKLFAESRGSSAQKQFVADTVHGASLIEAGGKLQQGAIYDNGQAYAYQSPLSVYGGSASLLPTAGRGAGGSNQPVTVMVSPEATQDLWRTGTTQAIQSNGRAIAQSAVNGYQQSSGRSGAMTSMLAPNAIQQ